MAGKRKGKSSRQLRVESELHRVVAELLAREVKDPRAASVTVTAVQAAPDLSVARVFYVPFEAPGQTPVDRAAVQAGLVHAAGFLRGEVGRRLALRHAPRLEFVFDDSLVAANRLTAAISSAVRADRERHPGSADDPAGDPSK